MLKIELSSSRLDPPNQSARFMDCDTQLVSAKQRSDYALKLARGDRLIADEALLPTTPAHN